MQTPRYREEVNRILADIEAENNQGQKVQGRDTQNLASHPQDTMQDVYFVFIRENPDLDAPQVVDSIPTAEPDTNGAYAPDLQATLEGDTQEQLRDEKRSKQLGLLAISFFLFLCLASITFQMSLMLNPPIATITIIPKSEQMTLTGTLQLGRVLNPVTLSQSQTTQTTGKGHQGAKSATGYITFYNGLFSEQTVSAGTTLTGSSGVQIVTDQDANIPPANPPSLGQVTVLAHAVSTGSNGNISAYDINQECCATAIKVVNQTSFSGGQDERNFQTVAKSDIDNAAAPLKDTLAQSSQGALTGQVKNGETLKILPCTPTVTPDHHVGEEATQVKVTVSLTCSGIAYNDQELTDKVMQLLTTQATKKLGAGYSILENPQITVTSATTAKQVMLSFEAQSTWVYALTTQEQQHIKKIIAGKYTAKALQLLSSLPGIERISLHFAGFGDNTRIPKNIAYIHLLIFYAAA